MWDRLSGRHSRIKKHNEAETYRASQRDRQEKDALVFRQLQERQTLDASDQRLEQYRAGREQSLSRDIGQYREIRENRRDVFEVVRKTADRDRGVEL